MSLKVKEVLKKSPAHKAGIKKNDIVHKIAHLSMYDFIDDIYVNSIINPLIEFERNGKTKIVSLDKDENENIGLSYFENLYPPEDSCTNKCVFCFVDQLPNEMRESLYVRDDDWRYSVLYGNYITMTNMTEVDFQRISSRKVSPLYISVHATDPDVRYDLLKNKNARKIMEQLKYLYDNKITFHSQIVLCPGINDGEVLNQTIEELASYYPYAKSLSIVPVGLTEHRGNLPLLKPVDEQYAGKTIDIVNEYRIKYKKDLSDPFVYVADELYSKANREYPKYTDDISSQKANGVGLFSDFLQEFESALKELENYDANHRNIVVVTGVSSYSKIKEMCKVLQETVKNLKIDVIQVVNQHFGASITVSGLLIGKDIIKSLGKSQVDTIFIPESTMRNIENVFLDNMTIKDVEKETGSCVILSPNDGYDFAISLSGRKKLE
ncbi:MAG: DUF512 domain-containing protein [Clostridiales bacterium]|nr:DUF512 domain-containing protein [Clostridiales bacterium]